MQHDFLGSKRHTRNHRGSGLHGKSVQIHPESYVNLLAVRGLEPPDTIPMGLGDVPLFPKISVDVISLPTVIFEHGTLSI